MDKPDRTDVIERLNRIIKKPGAPATPTPLTWRAKVLSLLHVRRLQQADQPQAAPKAA